MSVLRVLLEIAFAWFVAGLVFSLVGTVTTRVFQPPTNWWFIWRWRR